LNHLKEVLAEQQQYYDDRAPEYDDWWHRRGIFDEGEAANATWRTEAGQVQTALAQASLQGDILELAAGTGIWSAQLVRTARSLTLVDGSRQMLDLNPALRSPKTTAVLADVFEWRAGRTFDGVVFAFWISHVPRDLLGDFLKSVALHLEVRGKFFFVDNRSRPEASAPHVVGLSGELMKRRLLNGETSTIVKNYFSRDELVAQCASVGLEVEIFETSTLFQYGLGRRIA
jgi:2-polyprenyl-3-methyl-5-hydroxy-6-metoxy-1,4-benzoquinol methylase